MERGEIKLMGISKNSAYPSLPIAIGMEKGDGLRPLKTGFLEMPLCFVAAGY
jgi:hypothetical protein